jgi:hypothetical protein
MSNKKVVNITNDGFPLESWPPQGEITIQYDDGSSVTMNSNPIEEARLKVKHGLATQEHVDSVKREYGRN